MARQATIYTRTGDDGSTALATGRRLSKAALRIEAYGTIDELNSVIGLAIAEGCQEDVRAVLIQVQNDLFALGSELSRPPDDGQASSGPSIGRREVTRLETAIDRFSDELVPLKNFILPGGSRASALLHVARTVCRRAERLTVSLDAKERIGDGVIGYLNRLSDLLFTLARLENHRRGVRDSVWISGER